jgi:hypothetical protein
MIGPSKINNGGITFTLFAHTNREYGSTLAQNCGKPHSSLYFFSTLCGKPSPPPLKFSAVKWRGATR